MFGKVEEGEQVELTRGQRLWQRMRDEYDRGKLSLERARLVTASYKETEGLPAPIRQAKAFENVVTRIPIYIDNEQLLVGDFSSRPMWAEWYPEFAVGYVQEDMNAGQEAFKAGAEEIAEQLGICHYWKNRCVEHAFYATYTEEERRRFEEINEGGAGIMRQAGMLDLLRRPSAEGHPRKDIIIHYVISTLVLITY